jgi:hypothetical protein
MKTFDEIEEMLKDATLHVSKSFAELISLNTTNRLRGGISRPRREGKLNAGVCFTTSRSVY